MLGIIASVARAGEAPVWQWSVPVEHARENGGTSRAFLWIPPHCRYVRGVVVAQHNMEEQMILENPRFRDGMAGIDFAMVWVAPGFDHLFRFVRGPKDTYVGPLAGEVFDGMIKALADQSGYNELAFAPVVPMGHSAAASWPYYMAAWDNNRVLCALSVSGQWPYFRNDMFAPDIWGNRNIDGVPCLESMGEYESAQNWADGGLGDRQGHPKTALSMLANPGQGHFATTDVKCDYLLLYIRKAMQYRLPDMPQPYTAPPHLRPIDPTRTGWLADRWRGPHQNPTAPAAPIGRYTGDPKQAFWFFDKELAQATEAYQAAHRGKKAQLVGVMQGGQFLPQTTQHLGQFPKWQPQGDGITFKLSVGYYDAVPPPAEAGPPHWAEAAPGTPLGHADAPSSLDRVCGPFVKVGPDTFRIALGREYTGKEKQLECVFIATSPGDNSYRPAAQQAQMNAPARNTSGLPQTITFPRIPDQVMAAGAVRLLATSSAKLPVSYYVREGPATIDGGTLRLTAIPPRAKFPVNVTVVAWQYGRASVPAVQSAEPVSQTFSITP